MPIFLPICQVPCIYASVAFVSLIGNSWFNDPDFTRGVTPETDAAVAMGRRHQTL